MSSMDSDESDFKKISFITITHITAVTLTLKSVPRDKFSHLKILHNKKIRSIYFKKPLL